MENINDVILEGAQLFPIEVMYKRLKDLLNSLDKSENKELDEKEIEFICSLILAKRVILNIGVDKMKEDLNKVEIIKNLGKLDNNNIN